MPKCVAIDEAVDQVEVYSDLTARKIVDFILEEAVVAAIVFSDKGCSHIGDFNVTEDFCQQFDQTPTFSSEFEAGILNSNKSSASAKQELNLDSGESLDRSTSLLTARENLELILDSFIKKVDKVKNFNDCKIITEEILADNELRIENGLIQIEKNKLEESSKNLLAEETFYHKDDVIKEEKIEIEYFNDGKLNKIYVPLTSESSLSVKLEGKAVAGFQNAVENQIDEQIERESSERPFKPCTTEELRQVWENENSSVVEGWEGPSQSEDAVRLMEGLSSLQVFSDIIADPNRPRACALDEEDIKKMTKEIEEINFKQNHLNLDECATVCHSDGKGDADLESASLNAENRLKGGKKEKNISVSEKSDFKLHFEKVDENFGIQNISGESSDIDLAIQPTGGTESVKDIEKKNDLLNDLKTDEATPNNTKEMKEISSEPIIFNKINERFAENLSNSDLGSNDNERLIYKGESDPADECLTATSPTERGLNLLTDENITLRNSLGNIFYKNNEFPTSTSRLGSSKEIADVENNVSVIESSTMKLSMTDNFNSISSSEKNINNMKILHPEYENTDRELCDENSRQNSSEFVGNSLRDSDENCLEKMETNRFFLSEKEMEIPSPKSNSLYGTFKQNLLETTAVDFVLPQVSLFSNKSQEEIFEIDKVNHISYDFSYESSFLVSENNNMISTPNTRSQQESESSQSFEREIKTDSYAFTSKCTERERDDSRQVDDDTKFTENKNLNGEISNEKDVEVGSEKPEKQTPSSEAQESETSLSSDKDDSENGEVAQTTGKLHSQRIYSGVDFLPRAQTVIRSDSDEVFIDMVERVIQIIEPSDNSNDDDSNCVSFSLYQESEANTRSGTQINDSEWEPNATEPSPENNENGQQYSDAENLTKRKIYSGMTTIGPINNIDHDPKDLTSEVDFGKMTRITSSRQLGKDLFGSEMKSAPSLKILDDSDEDTSLTVDEGHMEIGTLINRDIASLTKVQKVREVMSYQPKPEEDFEDDSNLNRPRLDLKDVESMTDERFKLPEVSIPLLSFEVGETNSEVDKALIENMHLVLSGNCFANGNYYEEENNEIVKELVENNSLDEVARENASTEEIVQAQTSKISFKNKGKKEKKSVSKLLTEISNENDASNEASNWSNSKEHLKNLGSDSQSRGISIHKKYGTLSNIFRKASMKVIHKDGDLFLRSSKSLPRDASKIFGTDSIKSILDDCHSSATNILKKSRSFLRNTQTIFKTFSHSRFSLHGSVNNLDNDKVTPIESDSRKPERKLSFLKKEDFIKAKNLIRSKLDKTFKSANSSSDNEMNKSLEEIDLSASEKDGNNPRFDRMENCQKILPKSPLIYKSQFVKSQVSVQNSSFEKFDLNSLSSEIINQEQKNAVISYTVTPQNNKNVFKQEQLGLTTAESLSNMKVKNSLHKSFEKIDLKADKGFVEPSNEINEQQPDFIVLETVQGLSAADLEPSLYSMGTGNTREIEQIQCPPETGNYENMTRNEVSLFSAPNVSVIDNFYESLPRLYDKEENSGIEKTPIENKVKSKSKKLSARIRSFWCSAFGRVKTSSNKKEHS